MDNLEDHIKYFNFIEQITNHVLMEDFEIYKQYDDDDQKYYCIQMGPADFIFSGDGDDIFINDDYSTWSVQVHEHIIFGFSFIIKQHALLIQDYYAINDLWKEKFTNAANVIKKFFLEAYYNPSYKLCQRRIKRQFETIHLPDNVEKANYETTTQIGHLYKNAFHSMKNKVLTHFAKDIKKPCRNIINWRILVNGILEKRNYIEPELIEFEGV